MKLCEGEMICSRCCGTGGFYHIINKCDIICSKCNGEGKLDWVENVVGKIKQSNYVKPGVYVKEIDLSVMIPAFGENYDRIE